MSEVPLYVLGCSVTRGVCSVQSVFLAISSSSLTSNLLKSDQLLTTHRSPSTVNRDPIQTSRDRPRVAHLATVSDYTCLHGGLRPFFKSQLTSTQLTAGHYAVQIWSRKTTKTGPNETCVAHHVECRVVFRYKKRPSLTVWPADWYKLLNRVRTLRRNLRLSPSGLCGKCTARTFTIYSCIKRSFPDTETGPS